MKEFAQKEGISINQFIASAVTEKISAFATKDYLENRARRADTDRFEKALSQIPDIEPEEYDKYKKIEKCDNQIYFYLPTKTRL